MRLNNLRRPTLMTVATYKEPNIKGVNMLDPYDRVWPRYPEVIFLHASIRYIIKIS